jgi:hypothetical protein
MPEGISSSGVDFDEHAYATRRNAKREKSGSMSEMCVKLMTVLKTERREVPGAMAQ